jgi:hypothetical protein
VRAYAFVAAPPSDYRQSSMLCVMGELTHEALTVVSVRNSPR